MNNPTDTVKRVQFGIARKAYKRTRAEIKNRPDITVPQILKWLDNQVERLFELEADTQGTDLPKNSPEASNE